MAEQPTKETLKQHSVKRNNSVMEQHRTPLVLAPIQTISTEVGWPGSLPSSPTPPSSPFIRPKPQKRPMDLSNRAKPFILRSEALFAQIHKTIANNASRTLPLRTASAKRPQTSSRLGRGEQDQGKPFDDHLLANEVESQKVRSVMGRPPAPVFSLEGRRVGSTMHVLGVDDCQRIRSVSSYYSFNMSL